MQIPLYERMKIAGSLSFVGSIKFAEVETGRMAGSKRRRFSTSNRFLA